MSKLTVVTINLNYYKPGDDFFDHLEHDHDPEKALRAHSDQLKGVSEHLVKVADMVHGHEVTVDSDAHIITMTCDSKLAVELPPPKGGGFPLQRPLPTQDNASLLQARSL